MVTEMINFDRDEFKINDLEVDHEDPILKQELNQLIYEQLSNFDLSDEENQLGFAANDAEPCDSNDLMSVFEAGKLSLLEGAIQNFGECSENETTNSNELTSSKNDSGQSRNGCGFAKSHGQCIMNTRGFQHPEDHNNEPERFEDANNSHPPCNNYYNETKDTSSEPVLSWDLSLPDEIGYRLSDVTQHNTQPCTTQGVILTLPNHTDPSQMSSSAWSFGATPSSYFMSTTNPKNVIWPGSSQVPNPSHVTYDQMTHCAIPVSTLDMQPKEPHPASNEPSKTTSQKNGFIPCIAPIKTCSTYEKIDSCLLPSDKQDRRELLYAARGYQLQELQTEIIQLREDIAKEKRLSNHRLLLAEGDKETLRSKLSAMEDTVNSLRKELVAKQGNSEVLQKQLKRNEEFQKKLNEELIALRSTNESLSSQLVELTTGNALKRAEEREAQLIESLEQRFISKTEEIKAELNTTQRNLTEKEVEVTGLRRQLEISKAEIIKAQQTHHKMINEANKQLEEAQKHCQQLASSALCSEVTSLRQKVIELETSKKITEDVNKILQDELRDFRDQVSIYESVLKLDAYFHNNGNDENQFSYESSEFTPIGTKGRHSGKSVAFADTIEHSHINLHRRRPCSAIERPIYSADDNCTITGWDSNERPCRFRRNSDSKQPHSDNDDLADKACEYEQDGLFHSLTRQGILTSTPAVSVISPKSPMAKLRNELERCLLNYKAKREQVTKLHEILYTTRCQLHQSREALEKAEKSAKLLQERVLSLEQELSTLRSIGDNPGPREVLLSGQLERLRGDYAHLEEELQTTRTRLQAALGAEAKALEAEKTISERLAASVAERDAAVDRAKAVCEAQYAVMRRRLEADWANERETNACRAEEKLTEMKKALCEMEREVQRITNLYQESQISAKKAVENAVMEAMKLREAERMRFWREELPEQIEVARQSWILQMKTQNIGAEALTNKLKDKGCQTEACVSMNVSVNTSYLAKSTACIQTELSELLPIKFGIDMDDPVPGIFNNNEIKTAIHSKYPILSEYLSAECLFHLCTHLTETSCMNLCYLEKEIKNSSQNILEHVLQDLLKHIDNEIDRLTVEYNVAHIFNKDVNKKFFSENQFMFKCPDTLQCSSVDISTDKSDEILEKTSSNYCQKNVNYNYSKIRLSKMIGCEYQSVLGKILLLVVNLDDTSKCVQKFNNPSLNNTNSITYEQKSVQVSGLDAEYYHSIIQKIKADVLNYVELCQSRAAQILHSELARVHRRACRQFTSRLRQALFEAGAPIFSTLKPGDFCNKTAEFANTIDSNFIKNKSCQLNKRCEGMGLSEASNENDFQAVTTPSTPNPHSELESLLHIIDEVCASTETKFYANTSTGLLLFNHQFNVSKSLSNDEIIPQNSINNAFMCNNDVTTTSSHNTVTFTPYIIPECKQDHSLPMLHQCFHIGQNRDKNSSVKTVPNQFSNQINKINSLPSEISSSVYSNHLYSTEDLPSHITFSVNPITQIKSSDNNVYKPIPTPRTPRPAFVNVINSSPKLGEFPEPGSINVVNDYWHKKPVHTQLYKLFENFHDHSMR
uniref:Centrosomal protein of n=1 Tax=Schistosoma mansoni TaxID=6183 RepID=A0A5K4F1C5_SCHMA